MPLLASGPQRAWTSSGAFRLAVWMALSRPASVQGLPREELSTVTESCLGIAARISRNGSPRRPNITPPSDSVAVVDVTNMDSPNATKEFILGLNDPGEAKFSINFISGGAGDAKLQAVRAARKKVKASRG